MADPPNSRLPTPVPIGRQKWPATTKPVLSVRCITYNHAKFIAQCIEGFLIQETTFPVEIIIHDDASTDGTADVIRGYIERYPLLIKGVLQPKNLYSQGIPRDSFIKPLLRGDYIAVCEGDDYWTDPRKLETQVSFLEKNPDYVISGHDASIVDETGTLVCCSKLPEAQKRDHSGEELIRAEAWILTMSWVHRNVALDNPIERRRVINGDTFFVSLLGHHGKSKHHDDIMPAVYRKHGGAIWSALSDRKQQEQRCNLRFWLYTYYARIGEAQYAEYYWDRYLDSVFRLVPTRVFARVLVDRLFRLDRLEHLARAVRRRLIPRCRDVSSR